MGNAGLKRKEKNMEWITDLHEKEVIKGRAQEAIEKLNGIVKECGLIRAHVPYLTQKIEWAEAMVFSLQENIMKAAQQEEEVTA